jgi:hypothetical protein
MSFKLGLNSDLHFLSGDPFGKIDINLQKVTVDLNANLDTDLNTSEISSEIHNFKHRLRLTLHSPVHLLI